MRVKFGWKVLLLLGISQAWGQTTVVQLNEAQVWKRLEFQLDQVPTVQNPFDPEQIRVDATFRSPSGTEQRVPAFWFQDYVRSLSGGTETLRPVGTRQWRLRHTPVEVGGHTLRVTVQVAGQAAHDTDAVFQVAASASTNVNLSAGFVRIAEPSRRYFETSTGAPLPLNGACVSWHGNRGTYDYDDWFPAMGRAGENFARLWMAPWAFGIETAPGTRLNYRLDRAWQLDYVFQLAETHGIRLLLCLDYHGMFETEPDVWGGNNFWPQHPYNRSQGGPCATQNEFFTKAEAKALYQKRLRYLIGRYGYSPNLLAWQFFNEIDNVYRHLNASSVAAWHGELGTWLRGEDPFRHMITTSLTGLSDRPEIWSLAQMDFAVFHSYGMAQPVTGLAAVIQSFRQRYQKPVMIGEYGVDWRGWARESDPFLRGWRQGLWAGVLGGSVGTSMSWWWEQLHKDDLYPAYAAIARFAQTTGWAEGSWVPMEFKTTGPPPSTLASVITGAPPFSVTLALNANWGSKLPGRLAVADPDSSTYAASVLNSFVHGTAHPELRIPFAIEAFCAEGARAILHLNSVSSGAILSAVLDGREIYRWSIPNLDNGYQVNNEYNTNVTVNLTAGKHRLELRNTGQDWYFLDWVRLENMLPATYSGGWRPSPAAIGLQHAAESLVYVVNPAVHYPGRATDPSPPPMIAGMLTVTNSPPGSFRAIWRDPATLAYVSESSGTATNAQLTLLLPEFAEDLVGQIVGEFSLAISEVSEQSVRLVLRGTPGMRYELLQSPDLMAWQPVTNTILAAAEGPWTVARDQGSTGYFLARLAQTRR